MLNPIIRTEDLKSQGILSKNTKNFIYNGLLFKEGVSFSQQHRQLAIDMLRQQLANGKSCILVESDYVLTFYHQQTSINGSKHGSNSSVDASAPTSQSMQTVSLQKSTAFSPEDSSHLSENLDMSSKPENMLTAQVANPLSSDSAKSTQMAIRPNDRDELTEDKKHVSQASSRPRYAMPIPGALPLPSSASNPVSTMTDSQKYPMHMSSDSPNWLHRLVNQISQAHDLKAIFKAAVADLRPFLEIDRVKICKFQSDDRGQVIAEAIHNNRLPSILSLHCATDDLSPYSRELLLQSRGGAMVNLKTKTICKIPASNGNLRTSPVEKTNYLPIDSQYVQSLSNMGVKFSIVIPILLEETVWGMLIAHHSETHFISTRKFEVLQLVVDQLSVAISQQTLRIQTQTRAEQEASFNQIVNQLQASPNPEFQLALETAVAAFQGSGGRLCMSNPLNLPEGPAKDFSACLASSGQDVKLYTYGAQPEIPAMINSTLMEQYRLWQDHYQSGNYTVWPIANLYQTPELKPLFDAFRPTSISSLLMIPLTYGRQLLGYLSIFRNSSASNPPQIGKLASEQIVQGQEWTNLELAQKLGQQFAVAIHGYVVSQQLHQSNSHLNAELQQHTAQLQQVAQQQQGLAEMLTKIKTASDPETIFQTTTKELCRLLQAERVSVYRFNADWGGQFVHDFEYVLPNWQRSSKLGSNTAWNDTYLQETQGGRYRYNEGFSADDIYEANLSSCHIEILEQFHIKAFATAPVFVGKKLWGVLAAYQHSQVRKWLTTDVLFLSQTATTLGLALQQAELLAHNQDIIKPYQTLSNEFDLDSRSLPSG